MSSSRGTTQEEPQNGRRGTRRSSSVVAMNSRPARARRLVVPGALLLAASFALVGCSKGSDAAAEQKIGPIESRQNSFYDKQNQFWNNDSNDTYEEALAACMKESGFEYIPQKWDDGSNGVSVESASPDDQSLDPVANAKENGYYITPANKEQAAEWWGPGDTATDEPTTDSSGSLSDSLSESIFSENDPNNAYFLSLSDSDRLAYVRAMMGPYADMSPDDFSSADWTYDWTQAGCQGEASHEAWDQPMDQAETDTSVIDDFYSYASDKVANDDRVVRATTAWSSCMSGKGYTFSTSDDAVQSIQQRFDSLTGTDSNSTNPDGSWTPPDVSGVSDDDLAALHADEIATATADAECTVSSGLEKAQADAWYDADVDYYSTHKAEVDAYFDAQEAALKG